MTVLLQIDTSSPMTQSSRTTTLCPVSKRAPICEPLYSVEPLRIQAWGPSCSPLMLPRAGGYPRIAEASARNPSRMSTSGTDCLPHVEELVDELQRSAHPPDLLLA